MKKIKQKRRMLKTDVGFRTKYPTLKEIGWEPWFFDMLNETFCNDIYDLVAEQNDDEEKSYSVNQYDFVI